MEVCSYEQGRTHAACHTTADSVRLTSGCWGFSHGCASQQVSVCLQGVSGVMFREGCVLYLLPYSTGVWEGVPRLVCYGREGRENCSFYFSSFGHTMLHVLGWSRYG